MTLSQHHILALFLTAVTTLSLGLLVFLADPKKALNRVFAIYSASIACWSFGEAFLVNAPNQASAEFWTTWEWVGVSFIAPAFLHTILLVTGEQGRRPRTLVLLGYLAGGLFVLLHLLSGSVTLPARPVAYTNYFARLTLFGHYIPILFLCLVNVGLFKLWRMYRHTSGRKRIQLRYLFWSSFIGYLGGSTDWALTLGFYIPVFNPFGIYSVPFYSIATTYALLQHGLFDFRLMIRRSLVYSIVVTTLTVGYFGLIYGVELMWRGTTGYQSLRFSLIAFALMAVLFQPLKVIVQRGIDRFLFKMPHEELVRRVERLEHEVRQSEKMRAVATLAAGLAHEIRNPMTAIQTFVRFLPERYDDPEFRQRCRGVVVAEVDRVNQLLAQLLDFAKPKPPSVQPTDLHRLIESTLDFVSNETIRHRVQVQKALNAPDPVVPVDGNQMRQVLLNLILNGVEAMAPGGQLTVATARQNGSFFIEVRDTGCGIPAKDLPHIFDPFRTTKPQGNGLGLSVAYGLIKEHRGTLTVTSQVGQGTTFTIKLPA